MKSYIYIVIILLVLIAIEQALKKKPKEKTSLPIAGAYQKRWLLSLNEKDAYAKLKQIADQHGQTVFVKVRLLDLVEPISGHKNYKSYLYRIQAKHVDFVLCSAKMTVDAIIELDDNSHDTKNRQDRDAFIDEVLTSTGYRILHLRAITEETLQPLYAQTQTAASTGKI